MTVQDLARVLHEWAPPALAADYDNVGLLIGDLNAPLTGILLTLDVTEAVLDEALATGCNLIVAHHPIWFGSRTHLTDSDWIGRLLRRAIRHDINLFAIHTNLDHVADGVSAEMARRLGLVDTQVLQPLPDTLAQLTVYCPPGVVAAMEQALFAVGAGQVADYDQASIQYPIQAAFRPMQNAQPAKGQVGKREVGPEVALQVLFPAHREAAVLEAMRQTHPYEQPAYQVTRQGTTSAAYGAGIVGMLPLSVPKADFLALVANVFQAQGIRYADSQHTHIQRVALCGGSGSFLLKDAIRAGADAFITADVTYHKYFDNESRILYCDIGHWETEQYTPHLLHRYLSDRADVPLHVSQVHTNPVQYWQVAPSR